MQSEPFNRGTKNPASRGGIAAPARPSGRLGIRDSAALRALLISLGFYAVFYGILHPGYAILDDVKIISIATGYPGVTPAPFLIFSNVLLGIVLVPLYAMGTAVNWEIVLFSFINLLSLWTLLFLLLSGAVPAGHKAAAAVLVLACDAYFALNITFTSTAALACFAGLCAILGCAMTIGRQRRVLAVAGVALAFLGSLARLEMVYVTVPVLLTAVPFLYRRVRFRTLGLVAALAGLAVFCGYAFDRLYVRAFPAWNTYYFYNKVAQSVQDSHRLENLHLEIRRIGWSGNDQELFARSFFPDAGTYSLDHLRYLADHVSGIGQNPVYDALSILSRLASLTTLPFILIGAATWLWALATRAGGARLAIPAIAAVYVGESFGLAWIYKDPEYVVLASLANTVSLLILMLAWQWDSPEKAAIPRETWTRFAAGAILLAGMAGVVLSIRQAILTSSDNMGRQERYAAILTDLGRLQNAGALPRQAVIISPAYGIPVDWANPFLLDFPKIPYLDTGWSTFSPSYEEALRDFGIVSLPQALIENPNVYLMTETIFKDFLARFYEEHYGITVRFETVYTLGYPDRYAGYHEVELYRVIAAP